MKRRTSTRLLYTLFALQSLFSASQIAIFALVSIVAVELSGTERVAGLPSTTLTFTQALAALPLALLMARFGRRPGMTLAYLAGAVGGLAGMAAIGRGAFPVLLVSASLLGVGRAGSELGRFAAGEMFPESERARVIGRLVFAGTVGAVLGPLLVAPSTRWMESLGFVPETGPWAVAFVFSGMAALIAFTLLRPDPQRVAKELAAASDAAPTDEETQPGRPYRILLAVPKVRLAVLGMVVSQSVMVVLMGMTPLYMHHHQHSTGHISFVIAMHTLGMFGLSPLTGYLVDRVGRVTMLLAGALTLAVSALLAPLSANQVVLAAALFLLGLGWNFGYVAGSTLLAESLEGRERSRVQGINDSLVFLAAGFSSLGAGLLFAAGDYRAVSVAGLVMSLALVTLIAWASRSQLQTKWRRPLLVDEVANE